MLLARARLLFPQAAMFASYHQRKTEKYYKYTFLNATNAMFNRNLFLLSSPVASKKKFQKEDSQRKERSSPPCPFVPVIVVAVASPASRVVANLEISASQRRPCTHPIYRLVGQSVSQRAGLFVAPLGLPLSPYHAATITIYYFTFRI